MADAGDAALSAQERHLKQALARMGIKPREIVIPPPHGNDDLAPASNDKRER